MIKNIGLFISVYNSEETQEKARTAMERLGLSCCTKEDAFMDLPSERRADTFVFTDDPLTAAHMKEAGIGFAVYENNNNRSLIFPDALYVVDTISSLNIVDIDRMLLRFLHLPWTILETERCIIREITVDDVDRLYEIYNESLDAFRYAGSLYDDPEEEKAYTRNYINYQYRLREHGIWIVTDKESGRIIGRAGLDNREGYEDAELGYVFAIAYRHKGYAYEVCSAILAYAKNTLGMHALNAFTIRENADSIRLLKRLGFSFVQEAELDGTKHDRYRIIL